MRQQEPREIIDARLLMLPYRCELPGELGVVRRAIVVIRHEKVGRFAPGEFDLLQMILLKTCGRKVFGI